MQAPTFALPCWADRTNLYVQIPSDAGPVVITYPLTSMSKAIPLLQREFEAAPRPLAVPTPAQPSTVREVLSKLALGYYAGGR